MTVDSLAEEIRRLHGLCEVRRIESDAPRPRWTRWFSVFWASGVNSVVLLAFIFLPRLPPNLAGVFAWILLPFAALGLVHILIATLVETVFIVKELREDKKPFPRLESLRLPDLIREEVHLSKLDPGVVDHVIASQELNAAILQGNLNWMKGCVLGGAAGIVALVYQGSALRSMLNQWMSPGLSLSAQGVLLFGFCLIFALYVALWRRIVRSENRARFLKYIRERRTFLLALESEAKS